MNARFIRISFRNVESFAINILIRIAIYVGKTLIFVSTKIKPVLLIVNIILVIDIGFLRIWEGQICFDSEISVFFSKNLAHFGYTKLSYFKAMWGTWCTDVRMVRSDSTESSGVVVRTTNHATRWPDTAISHARLDFGDPNVSYVRLIYFRFNLICHLISWYFTKTWWEQIL